MKFSWKTSAIATAISCFASPAHAVHETVSLLDRDLKVILPSNYHSISYLGQDFLFAEDVNPINTLNPSYNGIIVNGQGKQIALNVPSGCSLAGAFLTDEFLASGSELPKGSFLLVHSPSGFGLCDLDGKIVLDTRYSKIESPMGKNFPVYEGKPLRLAFMFSAETGQKYAVPAATRMVLYGSGQSLRPFDQGGKFGYIDKEANVKIPALFDSAKDFHDGIATVAAKDPAGKRKYAFIDETGKIVSKMYELSPGFEDGYSLVYESTVRVGLIDRHLKMVFKPEYSMLRRLYDDVYAVGKANETCRVISVKGKEVFPLPPETENVIGYGDGLVECSLKNHARTSDPRQFIYLDTDGKIVLTINAVMARPFSNGLAAITQSWTGSPDLEFVNKEGKSIFKDDKDNHLRMLQPNYWLSYKVHREFCAANWQDPESRFKRMNVRFEEFAAFLEGFDFIQMPRAKVEELLGKSSGNRYCIDSSPFCGYSSRGFDVQYENDQVAKWREYWSIGGGVEYGDWVTTNVLLVSDPQELGQISNKPWMRFKEK